MQKLLINITVMAVLTVAAPIALATTRTIPLPHPSHYADTESSTNIALVGWNDQTRRFLVDLVAATTPSNCLELAYGTDANNDNILAPEETDLRLGLDCGEPFMRDEKNGEAVSRPLEESTHHSPTPTSNSNYSLILRLARPDALEHLPHRLAKRLCRAKCDEPRERRDRTLPRWLRHHPLRRCGRAR